MDKNINNKPLVSVIMPVYNGEKYLAEAIESVLTQTYKNLELIIVDDGSFDESVVIIKKYSFRDKRIRLLFNKKNLGISRTLNIAIENSIGKYVARLDCDDVSLPERIEKQVEIFESNRVISICGTWAEAIDGDGKKLFCMHSPTGILLKYNFWKPSPFISSSIMVRKEVIDKYRFDVKYKTSEDYDLWIRILRKHGGYNIPLILVKYRIHSDGIIKSLGLDYDKSTYESFINNIYLGDIDYPSFLSLVCKNYKADFFTRLNLLRKLKKEINYPSWFMLADNLYYEFRRILYKLNPDLNHYK